MSNRQPLHAFGGYGIELEYMIVTDTTLDVLPVSDLLIHDVAGAYVSELEQGALAWSNELVLHVIELKTNGPAADLQALPALFLDDVRRINGLLERHGGRLMPGAAHPWMDPARETRLWPHEYDVVYEAFDRIFGCQGHGWSNLQSMHINLPFAGDHEFGRLHTAIRTVLPLLPALAASSPILDGRVTGLLDSRLEAYRRNAQRIPAITGKLIPEPVTTRHAYQHEILTPIYRAIAEHDPDGILQHEWLNARGAIARFDRSAIEIRVLDTQETPAADLAIAAAVVGLVRALYEELTSTHQAQLALKTDDLAAVLLRSLRSGERTVVTHPQLLACLGWNRGPVTLERLWRHLLDDIITLPSGPWSRFLDVILEHGPLARRLLSAVDRNPSREHLVEIYGRLCNCLHRGDAFVPRDG